jgi:hypothetical protein
MNKSNSKSFPTPNHGKRWSAKDNELLAEAVESGFDVRETAKLLGRTVYSVHTRKSSLGVEERFPVTTREVVKRTLKEMKPAELEEVYENLLVHTREEVSEKLGVHLKSLKWLPDCNSSRTQVAKQAVKIWGKELAAQKMGVTLRSLYRYLAAPVPEEEELGPDFSFEMEDVVPEPQPEVQREEAPEVLNSSALLIRDIVLALRPYGVNCSFELGKEDAITCKIS